MIDTKNLLDKLNKCESEIEKLFLLTAYGKIDGLIPQYQVLNYRIDFVIPDKRIAIEIDGHEYHKTRKQRTHDSHRERNIKLSLPSNWELIRFTGSEIFENPTFCVETVLQFINKNSKGIRELENALCKSLNEHMESGIDLENRNKLEEAMEEYDAALEIEPKETFFLYKKAHIFEKQGKLEDAMKTINKAIEIEPHSDWLWGEKAEMLIENCNFDDATDCLNRAIEYAQEQDDLVVYLRRKASILWFNESTELIKTYEKIIELAPNDVNAWFGKAEALDNVGRCDEAISAYDEVIRLDPNCDAAWLRKGIIHADHDNYAEAEKCASAAMRIS